jgi:uncharacterized Rmd1/YagE family protein
MENRLKLSAILVANQLDLKGLKSFLEFKPIADSSSEVYYKFGEVRYQYFFNFGVIVFCGHSEDEIRLTVKTCLPYQKNPLPVWLRDDLDLKIVAGAQLQFEFNEVVADRLDDRIMRIAMFNLAQSVALDYYHQTSENLLTEIKGFTRDLENTGKLSIGRRAMLRFIGKALNTQNDIADNIYIFDAPELAWDDEYLDLLHKGLKQQFDLRVRFSEIEYTLRIIESNLSVFREISHQRESSILESIIILLILVEVFDLFISKLL